MSVHVINADVRTGLQQIESDSVHCLVTSPPYYGLRNYGLQPLVWNDPGGCQHRWDNEITSNTRFFGTNKRRWCNAVNGQRKHYPLPEELLPDKNTRKVSHGAFCVECGAWKGDLGVEPTPNLYIHHLVEIFREIMRVLHPEGTAWLNIGDARAGSWGNYHPTGRGGQRAKKTKRWDRPAYRDKTLKSPQAYEITGYKRKDMLGIPWRVAIALQEEGWWLRQDIIWVKTNYKPESVKDRPISSHEHIFMLSKRGQTYYNYAAVRKPARIQIPDPGPLLPFAFDGKVLPHSRTWFERSKMEQQMDGAALNDVWLMPVSRWKGAHYATFPPDLPRRCLMAGCPPGGTCLDPFAGTGTTGVVANEIGNDCILIELNSEDCETIRKRCCQQQSLLQQLH